MKKIRRYTVLCTCVLLFTLVLTACRDEEPYNFNVSDTINDAPVEEEPSTYSESFEGSSSDYVDEPIEESNNPADYDKYGNYKPVEKMSQEEMEAELEGMFNEALGQ